MNLKIGGSNVGKIMYGDKQAGKMYFGGKVVYQNALPVGTVLWSGNLTGNHDTSNEITLDSVKGDFSNVSDKTKFEVTFSNFKDTTIVSFAKSEFLSESGVFLKDKYDRIKLINVSGTNKITVNFINGGYYLKQIKLV